MLFRSHLLRPKARAGTLTLRIAVIRSRTYRRYDEERVSGAVERNDLKPHVSIPSHGFSIAIP